MLLGLLSGRTSANRTACLLLRCVAKRKPSYGAFLMYRVIVFIEFTFGDEDCFVAYPAGNCIGSRHDVAS